jgi:hypothetical protein
MACVLATRRHWARAHDQQARIKRFAVVYNIAPTCHLANPTAPPTTQDSQAAAAMQQQQQQMLQVVQQQQQQQQSSQDVQWQQLQQQYLVSWQLLVL